MNIWEPGYRLLLFPIASPNLRTIIANSPMVAGGLQYGRFATRNPRPPGPPTVIYADPPQSSWLGLGLRPGAWFNLVLGRPFRFAAGARVLEVDNSVRRRWAWNGFGALVLDSIGPLPAVRRVGDRS